MNLPLYKAELTTPPARANPRPNWPILLKIWLADIFLQQFFNFIWLGKSRVENALSEGKFTNLYFEELALRNLPELV